MNDHIDRLPRLTRILASAGSGKTFALTSRYLALVQRGVEPAAILATTFTRAAAAEILDRILARAAAAVLDDDRREELATSIGLSKADFDERRAATLLERIVRDLPRARIRTLDSFFAGIVTAFATELFDGGAPRVCDEGEGRTLLRDAIQLAMDEEDEGRMLDTLLALARGRRLAAVVTAVEREVEALLDLAAESTPEAWEWEVPRASSDREAQDLVADLRSAASRVTASRQQVALAKLGDQLAAAAAAGGDDWVGIASATLIKAAANDDPVTYYKQRVPGDVVEVLRSVGSLAVRETRRLYADMTRAMRDLAVAVGSRRARLERARGIATFEDLPAMLDPTRSPNLPALDELWFRFDACVRHILLDEFQDTSVVQWRALGRLAEEIVAGGDDVRSVFVVGDAKQAIYGWRRGEARLLESLPEMLGVPAGEVGEERLAKSYRSARAIVEFVDRVFGATFTTAVDEPVQRSALAAWAKRYSNHDTARAATGRVEVTVVPAGTDRRKTDFAAQCRVVVARVAEIRRRLQAGASIGVVLRSNKAVAQLARALQSAGHAVAVLGKGALLDREGGLGFLQALRLAEWPCDTVAAFDLACSPLAALVGLVGHGPDAPSAPAAAARASASLRRTFERHGVATTFDGWLRTLEPRLDEHETGRLRQLVATVARLESIGDRSPGELAELVMVAREERAAGGEVCVMTIHQSKGLEFEALVVADLEHPLAGFENKRRFATATPALPSAPIPRVTRWVKKDLVDVLPDMREVCDETTARNVEESASALYVALTRARSELYVVLSDVAMTGKEEIAAISRGTLAAIVRAAVGAGSLSLEGGSDRVVFEAGVTESTKAPPFARREAAAVSPSTPPRIRPAGRARHRASAASEADAATTSLRLRDRDAIDKGTAFHAALARVGWLDETHGDEELLDAMRIALPSRERSWLRARLDEVRVALDRPVLRDLLTRASPRADVRTEYPFVRVVPEGIQSGAIDRLVVHRDPSGRPARAELVDYKTDAIPAGELDALRTRHAAQLRVYREVVAGHLGLAPERVAVRLFALAHDAVVEFGD